MAWSPWRLVVVLLLTALETLCDISNEVIKQGPRIAVLNIRSDIVYRFAETAVTSTIINDGFDPKEATFDVSLPEAAFISNFTLDIGGKIYPGEVKEKEAAKAQYEKAKKRGHSAGHIATRPRDTNKFNVKINVAPLSHVTFVLTYDELLQRRRGQYEHIIYIDPKQIVDELLVEVYIFESREITALRIPPLRNDILESYEVSTSNELAEVSRPSPKTAYIRYSPSTFQQKMISSKGVSGLFKVQYDVRRSLDAGDIYVVNGYFTHFFAPVGIEPLRKRILFVLDISGSMSFGRKIIQLKEAMTHILKDLKEEDLFNIITFESTSFAWSESMRKATQENINEATEMVQDLMAEGGTNVNEALLDGLNILQHVKDLQQSEVTAPLIVFLTDGDPTVGVTSFKKILNNVDSKNKQKIQIFCLAFGKEANFNFLKKISARNNAVARTIYADSDAALQLTGFYDEISDVLLSKVSFSYLDNTVNLTSVTQSQFPSFFDGSELVVAGKLNELDKDFNTLTLSVVGSSQHGVIELSDSKDVINMNQLEMPDFKTSLNFETITERMWAYLTVKKLMKELLKTENYLLKNNLREEALAIALKYNFVTPVTSMVVTKPEEKKQIDNDITDNNIQEDDPNGGVDNQSPGVAALTAPTKGPQGLIGKGSYKKLPGAPGLADSDPHFIVKVKGLKYAICFDVMGEQGDMYQLINDRYSGLTVNARVVANQPYKHQNMTQHEVHYANGEIKTFLGVITIKRHGLNMIISPLKLKVNGEPLEWSNGTTYSHGKTKIVVDTNSNMVVVLFHDRVTLLVMRHLRPKPQLKAGKVNFLGFYIVDSKGLSYHTHGLLGQFLHRTVLLKKTKNRKGRLMGRLRVTGNTTKPRKVMATLGHRMNLATNKTVSCWMVQHNGAGLLDGNVTDYMLQRGKDNGNKVENIKNKVAAEIMESLTEEDLIEVH